MGVQHGNTGDGAEDITGWVSCKRFAKLDKHCEAAQAAESLLYTSTCTLCNMSIMRCILLHQIMNTIKHV